VRSCLTQVYLIVLILLVSVAAHAADVPSSKTSKKRQTRRASNSRLLNRNSSNFTTEAWNTLSDDYMEFYSLNRLKRMGLVFASGAIVANTNIDEYIQKKYQTNIRSSTTDDIADVVKDFGEYKYLIPVTVAAALIDNVFEDTAYNRTVGRWGKRMMRSYLVGTPLLLTLQPIIGASRPSEGMGSNWHPFSFDDVNGISTHAFIGAVPFLTMAGMSDDNLYLKSFFYLASTACAWSRINDNAHYFSQAALGWYLAWESTDAILDRENEEKKLTVRPMFLGDGYGISINMQW
jgi:hypothetical protein